MEKYISGIAWVHVVTHANSLNASIIFWKDEALDQESPTFYFMWNGNSLSIFITETFHLMSLWERAWLQYGFVYGVGLTFEVLTPSQPLSTATWLRKHHPKACIEMMLQWWVMRYCASHSSSQSKHTSFWLIFLRTFTTFTTRHCFQVWFVSKYVIKHTNTLC